MGALTSNRKRGDENFSYNNHHPSPYQNTPDFHVSKKPKSMHQSPDKPAVISSNSTVSRISQYPETKPQYRRQVHAPIRNPKFGFATRSNQDYSRSKTTTTTRSGFSEINNRVSCEYMGNFFSNKYDYAKREAIGALKYYFVRDKEVIDTENGRDRVVISVDDDDDDSSVEEVVVIEDDGLERRNVGDFDVKTVEELNLQPSSSSAVTEVMNGGDVRVENAGKMLDSLSLEREADLSSFKVYKKLLEDVERGRNSKLKILGFEIELNEKRRASFQVSRPVKKPVEEEPVEEVSREPFVPVTEEEVAEVEQGFSARRQVLVTHKNSCIDITGQMLLCLRPGAWLNDEVINVYLELLKEREIREPQKFLKCHFFNTFFYNKLKSGGFRAVKRWTSTKKLGYSLIECDKIFVPIHKEIHWCLAIINTKDQKLQYLDSLKGKDHVVLKSLAAYFAEEVKDKSGRVIDISSWEKEFVEDLPEQENGFDCGMFMLKYVDFHSRGLGLTFNQGHMPYFRVRTAKEILRLRAD